MLTPEQIEGFRLAAGRLIDPINTYLLKDIARRIQDAGKLTSTAAYEAWRAEWLGKDRKELERDLAQLLGVTRGEARKLLRTAARYGYDTTLSRYPGHLIPFDANPAIQQIVSAAVALAGDGLKNITQTKAIMLMDPYGQYQTLPKAYMACTDYAFQQVFTGAADYNTAIRRACSGIVKHGVSVAYASGVHTGLEAAVRRNIMGGLGLMTEQISQQNHDALGCNGWEISAHANSAPDHEPIQGLQYSDAAYEELNNSLVRRIGTLNCGDLYESMYNALDFPYKGTETTVLARLIDSGVCTASAANALGLLNREYTARQIADRYLSAGFQMEIYETEEQVHDEVVASNASGFFITADGLAVTNYHSIEDAIKADIVLLNGERYGVERVLYYDTAIDIAVIKVSKTAENTRRTTSAFNHLELVGTADIRPGDSVYAIGNPLGLGLAISSGIIASAAHELERYALPCVVNSADISRGSSGGALLNTHGQVIAVTSGAYTYGNNMYLAVPVNPVMTADLTGPGWTLEEVKAIETAKKAD